jgi:hypothetical protein
MDKGKQQDRRHERCGERSRQRGAGAWPGRAHWVFGRPAGTSGSALAHPDCHFRETCIDFLVVFLSDEQGKEFRFPLAKYRAGDIRSQAGILFRALLKISP